MGTLNPGFQIPKRCPFEDPHRPGRCALTENRGGRCPVTGDCEIYRDGPHPGETVADAVRRVLRRRPDPF